MAKLDELLGKYLPEWPDGADFIVQDDNGRCWPSVKKSGCDGKYHAVGRWSTYYVDGTDFYLEQVAEDNETAKVTRNQYLAARDRIAMNAQATKEAREIAQGEGQRFCSSEHMIAVIESEELPKPDRKLWKRAALAAFTGYCARPGMDAECAAEEAMFAADAFMNAMGKHLNSN